ncbi:DUF6387 family protein [Enterobacter cloacae]|uniref:DUF6387 family protein n=1 Tax=Enterobacter cloacae complex TaxID=354276 RepID=UPI001C5BFB85|nr:MULTISPECIES: DUF6387 family protein [Enterobacter cloacae complex]EKM6298152.1 hypothetical protein [Escherichia coli]ELD3444774.1 hypothetical protein [Enterobacter hormaechei]EKM6299275.1 hypothetical protein [Escherichia coli]MBW4211971.1 hypothetical protein [Enterobacter asburiae]MCK7013815.1 DUF6387 family protein [Enterobacter roggenkampii]
MATRVQVKEITSWMSVEKYDVFESLTVEEVLSEIEFRTIFACEYDPNDDEEREQWKQLQKSLLQNIQSGAVVSKDIPEDILKVFHDESIELNEPVEFLVNGMSVISKDHHLKPHCSELSEDEAIQAFTMADLVTYYRHFANANIIQVGERQPTIKEGKIFSSVSALEEGSEYFEGEVVIKVNLASYTDDELLSEFKGLLKSWRSEVGMDEPESGNFRIGISTLKKILLYKLIPFIDLLLWEKVHERKISNELIARILFPLKPDSDVIGGTQVKDTIRPFVERFVNDNALQQVKFYAKKNDYLKNMRLSDVLKLSED